jgi:hypothetical protein
MNIRFYLLEKNGVNQPIIGSFLYENEENTTLMFFHSVVTPSLLVNFLQRHISYLDVLKKASSIYQVEKNYSYQIIRSEEIEFIHINKDILPLPSAYCPITDVQIGFNQKALAY